MKVFVADLPLGVLDVNSVSKQKVSSALDTAGLNGGEISFLRSFYKQTNKQTNRSKQLINFHSVRITKCSRSLPDDAHGA